MILALAPLKTVILKCCSGCAARNLSVDSLLNKLV
jgi:hypothetical protein